ncbi:hypothetical protein Clacol_003638 [Clathrus columnatus]|uniref:Aconitate hydratase, mitochondrial n=1 Tax=Clathrus columnatus TaxID=1419009 RepID=A0AAV5A8S3_9AGAM|nr:hypothetical protein Clacol_003638 [Clathrus columnatus]
MGRFYSHSLCRIPAVRAFATQTTLSNIKDCSRITPPYSELLKNLNKVRKHISRPLTLSEKILYSHLHNPDSLSGVHHDNVRGSAYLQLRPQRVAMQDASAQMALLQFMTCGLSQTSVPTSIHCDHLIRASEGAESDLDKSIITNKEVFDFLESASRKYGIEFWRPGSGIIHQVVLENYAAPGMLMLGTDSHTPNAGGLGLLAIGVGGADAVDAMTGTPWELKAPLVLGIKLIGKLNDWVTPKDLILHISGLLTVRGGTGKILEYFGPGVESQSCTGLATVCNMGAEVGGTTSIFPYTQSMRTYLHATGRAPVADAADWAQREAGYLRADEGAEYDEVIEIDLSSIEPTLNGPFTPDLATPLSVFGDFVREQGWKDEISAALIGSCTNSSYEDMTRVADLVKQADAAGLKIKVPFLCTPGSEQIRATMERDGITKILEDAGAVVLANACGPCIGQMNFLASPTTVTALAYSGKLSFNPLLDNLQTPDGRPFKFQPPVGVTLPSDGFTPGVAAYYPTLNPKPQSDVEIVIAPNSARLEVLQPFLSHFGPFNPRGLELPSMTVLMRVRGKCTTDHISAAAMNDEGGEMNVAFDYDHAPNEPFKDSIPNVAERFKLRGTTWALVVDQNYGEGSAREHAALQPRFYGCGIIVARSFARIHETNLKKQGILPLWFVNETDYNRIDAGDRIETNGLADLLKGTGSDTIMLQINKRNGDILNIATKHTMSPDQLKWLYAGSALNHIRTLQEN